MKRVGILGGGQLGMLLSQSIQRLGAEVLIFDPDRLAPACRVVKESINAPWDDQKALAYFFDHCDVVTYEFENVPSASLKQFESVRPIYPSLSVLETTQSRILEKNFLKDSNLPYVPFTEAIDPTQLPEAAKQLNFPIIAKSATGGYDGKWQYLLKSPEQVFQLADELQSQKANFSFTLEEVVELQWELSCLTVRSRQAQEIALAVLKNSHVDHILDTTTMPAEIPYDLESKLIDISFQCAEKLKLTGLLCTEFFIAKSSKNRHTAHNVGDFAIYINELAPRPHNSGHVTLSALSLSQFDALARVLLDIPLSKPKMLAPGYFCMGNLLGDLWLKQGKGSQDDLDLSGLRDYQQIIDIVIYGKAEAKPKRKMGHVVAHGTSTQEAEAYLKRARQSLAEIPRPITRTI